MMVPRPQVVALSVDLPPEECLAAVLDSPYTRYPVYREHARRDRRHPSRARPVLGAHRPRHRERRRRGDPARAVHRPRDEGPGGDARRVPAHEPAHGDRRRRVRRDAGHRHARGPARGDRRRDRGRVRPARRVGRADRRRHDQDRRHLSDRRLQRAVREELPARTSTRSRGFVFGLVGRAAELGDSIDFDGLRFDVVEVEGSRIQKLAVTFVERPSGARPRTKRKSSPRRDSARRSYTRRHPDETASDRIRRAEAPPAWPRPRGFPRPERLAAGRRVAATASAPR